MKRRVVVCSSHGRTEQKRLFAAESNRCEHAGESGLLGRPRDLSEIGDRRLTPSTG